MNSKKFTEAMSESNNKYVDEANGYKKKSNKPHWVKWGAMAACFCLIVLGSIIISEYTKLTMREIDLTTSDIAEISSDYADYTMIMNCSFDEAPIPEGSEPFTGILGFDGYRVKVEESTPSFFIWHYYAEHEGKQVCIAEQFGYLVSGAEPEVYSIDLDGDTIPELVCNVVYGTGAERIIVYRNNGGIIERGTIDQSYHENEFGADAWHDGANCIGEKYDPVEGSFGVTKTTSDGSIKTASFKGLDNFIFLPYDLHEANN